MKKILFSLLLATILFSCSKNGDKVSQDFMEVYYKDGITKQEAQKALDYFLPRWKEKDGETARKSIQLTKNGDTINFKMVSNMEVMDKMEDELFYTTGNELSENLFGGAPVNVLLSDKYFKTIRTYSFKKLEKPVFGKKVSNGNIEVYIKDSFSEDQGTDMAGFLNKSMQPANIISFQVGKNENGNYVVSMVANREKADALPESNFMALASEISENTLNGAPLIFQLTDDLFKPFKTFNYKME